MSDERWETITQSEAFQNATGIQRQQAAEHFTQRVFEENADLIDSSEENQEHFRNRSFEFLAREAEQNLSQGFQQKAVDLVEAGENSIHSLRQGDRLSTFESKKGQISHAQETLNQLEALRLPEDHILSHRPDFSKPAHEQPVRLFTDVVDRLGGITFASGKTMAELKQQLRDEIEADEGFRDQAVTDLVEKREEHEAGSTNLVERVLGTEGEQSAASYQFQIAPSFSAFLENAGDNKVRSLLSLASGLITESSAQSAKGVAAGLAASAATGGNPVAFGAAMGAASADTEFKSTFLGELEKRLNELNGDFTVDNITSILEDEEFVKAVERKAGIRGGTIGTIEGLTGIVSAGLANKIGTKSVAGVIGATATDASVGALGGSSGEFFARVFSGDDFSSPAARKEIFAEGVAELGQSGSSVVSNTFSHIRERRADANAEADAPVDTSDGPVSGTLQDNGDLPTTSGRDLTGEEIAEAAEIRNRLSDIEVELGPRVTDNVLQRENTQEELDLLNRFNELRDITNNNNALRQQEKTTEAVGSGTEATSEEASTSNINPQETNEAQIQEEVIERQADPDGLSLQERGELLGSETSGPADIDAEGLSESDRVDLQSTQSDPPADINPDIGLTDSEHQQLEAEAAEFRREEQAAIQAELEENTTTLAQFIKDRGGIRAPSTAVEHNTEALEAFNGGGRGAFFGPGVFTAEGRPADELVQVANEAGFNFETGNQILESLQTTQRTGVHEIVANSSAKATPVDPANVGRVVFDETNRSPEAQEAINIAKEERGITDEIPDDPAEATRLIREIAEQAESVPSPETKLELWDTLENIGAEVQGRPGDNITDESGRDVIIESPRVVAGGVEVSPGQFELVTDEATDLESVIEDVEGIVDLDEIAANEDVATPAENEFQDAILSEIDNLDESELETVDTSGQSNLGDAARPIQEDADNTSEFRRSAEAVANPEKAEEGFVRIAVAALKGIGEVQGLDDTQLAADIESLQQEVKSLDPKEATDRLAEVALGMLEGSDQHNRLSKFYKQDDPANWDDQANRRFADHFQSYLTAGDPPPNSSRGIQRAFNHVRILFQELYKKISKFVPAPVKSVLDDLVTQGDNGSILSLDDIQAGVRDRATVETDIAILESALAEEQSPNRKIEIQASIEAKRRQLSQTQPGDLDARRRKNIRQRRNNKADARDAEAARQQDLIDNPPKAVKPKELSEFEKTELRKDLAELERNRFRDRKPVFDYSKAKTKEPSKFLNTLASNLKNLRGQRRLAALDISGKAIDNKTSVKDRDVYDASVRSKRDDLQWISTMANLLIQYRPNDRQAMVELENVAAEILNYEPGQVSVAPRPAPSKAAQAGRAKRTAAAGVAPDNSAAIVELDNVIAGFDEALSKQTPPSHADIIQEAESRRVPNSAVTEASIQTQLLQRELITATPERQAEIRKEIEGIRAGKIRPSFARKRGVKNPTKKAAKKKTATKKAAKKRATEVNDNADLLDGTNEPFQLVGEETQETSFESPDTRSQSQRDADNGQGDLFDETDDQIKTRIEDVIVNSDGFQEFGGTVFEDHVHIRDIVAALPGVPLGRIHKVIVDNLKRGSSLTGFSHDRIENPSNPDDLTLGIVVGPHERDRAPLIGFKRDNTVTSDPSPTPDTSGVFTLDLANPQVLVQTIREVYDTELSADPTQIDATAEVLARAFVGVAMQEGANLDSLTVLGKDKAEVYRRAKRLFQRQVLDQAGTGLSNQTTKKISDLANGKSGTVRSVSIEEGKIETLVGLIPGASFDPDFEANRQSFDVVDDNDGEFGINIKVGGGDYFVRGAFIGESEINIESMYPNGGRAAQSRSAGVEALGAVVASAQAMGVKKISTFANDTGGDTGFSSWANLGFDSLDGTVEFSDNADPAAVDRMLELGDDGPDILKITSTKEGRKLWANNGKAYDAEFSLTPGSDSLKRLDAIIKFLNRASTPDSRLLFQGDGENLTDTVPYRQLEAALFNKFDDLFSFPEMLSALETDRSFSHIDLNVKDEITSDLGYHEIFVQTEEGIRVSMVQITEDQGATWNPSIRISQRNSFGRIISDDIKLDSDVAVKKLALKYDVDLNLIREFKSIFENYDQASVVEDITNNKFFAAASLPVMFKTVDPDNNYEFTTSHTYNRIGGETFTSPAAQERLDKHSRITDIVDVFKEVYKEEIAEFRTQEAQEEQGRKKITSEGRQQRAFWRNLVKDEQVNSAGAIWEAIAKSDDNFIFGKTDSKNADDIANAVSTEGNLVEAVFDPGEILNSEYELLFTNQHGGSITLTVFDGKVEIYALNAQPNGKQLYAAAFDYIANNGLIDDNPPGLTDINKSRKVSNMLSSALRNGSTQHLSSNQQLQIGWSKKPADFSRNVAALAVKEMRNTLRAIPQAKDFRFDFVSNAVIGKDGRPVGNQRLRDIILEADPSETGVGVGTLVRGVITNTAIQENVETGSIRALASKLDESGGTLLRPPLYQDARGFFDPGNQTIGLNANANNSTFPHELWHAIDHKIQGTELGNEFAKFYNGWESGLSDQEVTDQLRILTLTPDDKPIRDGSGNILAIPEQRELLKQEQKARHFERYLRDGKAPKGASKSLRDAFKVIKDVMKAVYRKLSKGDPLYGGLPAEAKALFDQLLLDGDRFFEQSQPQQQSLLDRAFERTGNTDVLERQLGNQAAKKRGPRISDERSSELVSDIINEINSLLKEAPSLLAKEVKKKFNSSRFNFLGKKQLIEIHEAILGEKPKKSLTNNQIRNKLKSLIIAESGGVIKTAEDVISKLKGSNEITIVSAGVRGSFPNYTNSEGVELTLKNSPDPFTLNGVEVAGDIEIESIFSKNRNNGAASREMDRLLKVVDDNDLSISLEVDAESASLGSEEGIGLSQRELIEWYKRKGFIFNGSLGYRANPGVFTGNLVARTSPHTTAIQKEFDQNGEIELNQHRFVDQGQVTNPRKPTISINEGGFQVLNKDDGSILSLVNLPLSVSLADRDKFADLFDEDVEFRKLETKYIVSNGFDVNESFDSKKEADERISELAIPENIEGSVEVFDLEGESITTFSNLKEAIEEMGGFDSDGLLLQADKSRAAKDFSKKDAAVSFVKKKFRSRGDLPEGSFKAKVSSQGLQNRLRKDVEHNLNRLETAVSKTTGFAWNPKRKKEQQQLLEMANEVLVGARDIADLPGIMQGPVRDIRAHVDRNSDDLIQLGVTAGPLEMIVDNNKGTYLNRSYRIFGNRDKWIREIPVEIINRAEGFLRTQSPREPNESLEDYDSRMEGYLNRLLYNVEEDSPMAFLGKTGLGQKDVSVFIGRKDIPFEIRALWGEFTEAHQNYAQTVFKQASLIASQDFFNEVLADGQDVYLFDKPTGVFAIRIKNSNEDPPGEFDPQTVRVGNLSDPAKIKAKIDAARQAHVKKEADFKRRNPIHNMYTTVEIAKEFNGMSPKELHGAWKALLTINGIAKYSKTVLNPVTHVRNYHSNKIIMIANGHLPTSFFSNAQPMKVLMSEIFTGRTLDLIESKFGYRTKEWRAQFNKYVELGILEDGIAGSELHAVMQDTLIGDPTLAQFSENRMKKVIGKANAVPQKLYQAEDGYWKIVAFEKEKARYKKAFPNMSEADLDATAAQIVRDTMPTYSLVPEGVQVFRRVPFAAPFVSFASEIFRTNWHILKLAKKEMNNPATRSIGMKRIAGYAVAHFIPLAIAGVLKLLSNTDDEDDDAIRELVAPWDQTGQLAYIGKDKEGNPRFINMSYSDPYSMIKRGIQGYDTSFHQKGDPYPVAFGKFFLELFAPFVQDEIGFGALTDIKANKKGSTGGPVYEIHDTEVQQAKKISEHLWKAIEPGFVSSGKRINKARKGERSSSGKAFSLNDELIALSSGQRRVTVDPENHMTFASSDFGRARSSTTGIFSRVATNSGTVSDKEILSSFNRANRQKKEAFEDFRRKYNAAVRFKSMDSIDTVVRGAGISESTLNTIKTADAFEEVGFSDSFKNRVDKIPGRRAQIERALGIELAPRFTARERAWLSRDPQGAQDFADALKEDQASKLGTFKRKAEKGILKEEVLRRFGVNKNGKRQYPKVENANGSPIYNWSAEELRDFLNNR